MTLGSGYTPDTVFTIDPSNVEVSPTQTYLSYNHDLIGLHTFKLTATHADPRDEKDYLPGVNGFKAKLMPS